MLTARRALTAFALVSAFAIGCDSTQPDRVETRDAALSFEAGADTKLWACYELPSPTCFPDLDQNGIHKSAPRTVPWHFSVRITIIRAGGVVEELATSLTGVLGSSVEPDDLIDDFGSLTNYDPITSTAPDRTVGGTTYTNGHFVSTANPLYLMSIGVDPGATNLLDEVPAVPTEAPTFAFTLNSGDTVIARARKQTLATGPSITPPFENLKLIGHLVLSGVEVPLLGVSESPTSDGAGFTFSFTVQ